MNTVEEMLPKRQIHRGHCHDTRLGGEGLNHGMNFAYRMACVAWEGGMQSDNKNR
jgi:hypothetical protein